MNGAKIIVIGKAPSRKISMNLESILGLLSQNLLTFENEFIAMDPHRGEEINDMICDIHGKMLTLHGTLRIKLMPNGQIIGRFDPDE